MLGVWMLPESRRRGIGTALGGVRARSSPVTKAISASAAACRKTTSSRSASFSSLGALVPIYNPEMRFELPLV